jgi:hypothetical protein
LRFRIEMRVNASGQAKGSSASGGESLPVQTMKKRSGKLLIAATCVVAFAMSAPGHAIPTFQSVNCAPDEALADVGGGPKTVVCPFDIAAFPTRVSRISTHANFHARLSMGTVTMEWFDRGNSVAKWVCSAPGLYMTVSSPTGQHVNVGPADTSTAPNCSESVTPEASFASGPQLLVVTAQATTCLGNDPGQRKCPFHGFLQLQPAILPV